MNFLTAPYGNLSSLACLQWKGGMRMFHLTAREDVELSSPFPQGMWSFQFLISKLISKFSRSVESVTGKKRNVKEDKQCLREEKEVGEEGLSHQRGFPWEGLTRGPFGNLELILEKRPKKALHHCSRGAGWADLRQDHQGGHRLLP